jgi:uncharacterized membrane protein
MGTGGKAGAAALQERPRRSVNVGAKERKASVAGGAALAATGAAALAKRRFLPGIAMLAAGGMLVYRGKTGHCNLYQAIGISTATDAVTMEKTVTVNRPKREVYDYWRRLENLPSFMKHVDSVRPTGAKSSHWKASGPGGVELEWDAEITSEKPGEEISWRTVDGAEVENSGSVEFHDAPGGRGTEVHVTISFRPPGGAAGKMAATLGNFVTSQFLEEDLKRFKQVLETGEIATEARM